MVELVCTRCFLRRVGIEKEHLPKGHHAQEHTQPGFEGGELPTQTHANSDGKQKGNSQEIMLVPSTKQTKRNIKREDVESMEDTTAGFNNFHQKKTL